MRVLVAYASKAGSTAEVAECIGKTIAEAGVAVDVLPVQKVRDIAGYEAVVIGSAARMGRLLPAAVRFARKHARRLAGIPTACFVVCLTMKADTPENRATVTGYAEPLCRVKAPTSLGLFAGKFDVQTLEPLFRFMLGRVKSADMAPGDYRDWNAIRAWAKSVAAQLPGGK
jgi:menaquinone-dependent protoporphyrinogen oxidase